MSAAGTDALGISGRVEDFYRLQVMPRMAGLPFLNPRLRVEAVGFSLWQGQWLGCLVTPWSINLLLLPAAAADWPALALGEKRRLGFAAGEFEFVCGIDPDLGEHHDCSLFSPALEFLDQAAAVATARAVLAALHSVDAVDAFPIDCETPSAPRPAPLSRRAFLRGSFADGH